MMNLTQKQAIQLFNAMMDSHGMASSLAMFAGAEVTDIMQRWDEEKPSYPRNDIKSAVAFLRQIADALESNDGSVLLTKEES